MVAENLLGAVANAASEPCAKYVKGAWLIEYEPLAVNMPDFRYNYAIEGREQVLVGVAGPEEVVLASRIVSGRRLVEQIVANNVGLAFHSFDELFPKSGEMLSELINILEEIFHVSADFAGVVVAKVVDLRALLGERISGVVVLEVGLESICEVLVRDGPVREAKATKSFAEQLLFGDYDDG